MITQPESDLRKLRRLMGELNIKPSPEEVEKIKAELRQKARSYGFLRPAISDMVPGECNLYRCT